MKKTLQIQNSPTHLIYFKGRRVFLKRDDLLDERFSGNKARKLFFLLKEQSTPKKILISRGSILSNAMYSLSVLAKMKGWRFIYYAHHRLPHLINHPEGNLKASLQNGMELEFGSFSSKEDFWRASKSRFGEDSIIVDEGGRELESWIGIYQLAKEIRSWAKTKPSFNKKVFLPSGTGTTALFLSKFFIENEEDIKVFTTPCVSRREYLLEQFGYLESESRFYPEILESTKRYRFGKLYPEFYKVWLELQKETGVEFELLYDPLGWLVMQEFEEILTDGTLYIHQGGLLGNETMSKRYKKLLGDRFDKDFK
jgi:1-aminocyclopropane-1-carboxylate deaminase/D-cysteine desulfhydrase-like pyridoxal-dependent ACC family enzyme